jgi:hypothetical protein
MAEKYPWYEVVEGEELEQGDILRSCPVILPIANPTPLVAGSIIAADVSTFDVVVMTQSCDLTNDKVQDIILCPHWGLRQASQMDASLANKGTQKAILKGHHYRYAMLAASGDPEVPMDIRLVDFGRIFSLPKTFVREFAAQQGKRLRLSPPYREHLSQSSARFFMRVGLPQDIELPD